MPQCHAYFRNGSQFYLAQWEEFSYENVCYVKNERSNFKPTHIVICFFFDFSNCLSKNCPSFHFLWENVKYPSPHVFHLHTALQRSIQNKHFPCSYMLSFLHKLHVLNHGKVNIPFFRVTCRHYSKNTKGSILRTPSICPGPRRQFSTLKETPPAKYLFFSYTLDFRVSFRDT